MKKRKLPGENISLKTKKNESAAVMEWLNSQTNLMDSIRYLIETEIQRNGVRNLQHFIPSDRSAPPVSFFPVHSETAATSELDQRTSYVSPEAARTRVEPQTDSESVQKTVDEIDDEDIESWL